MNFCRKPLKNLANNPKKEILDLCNKLNTVSSLLQPTSSAQEFIIKKEQYSRYLVT